MRLTALALIRGIWWIVVRGQVADCEAVGGKALRSVQESLLDHIHTDLGKVGCRLCLAFHVHPRHDFHALSHQSNPFQVPSGCATSICRMGWISQIVPRERPTWSGCSGSN